MGWAARIGQKRHNYKTTSVFARFWPSFPPNVVVIMWDRIYGVDPWGALRRLPVGEAFNVKVVNVEV